MNLYGLNSTYETSEVIVIPVPWEGTVSYGRGTAAAPEAILEASSQIDLCDVEGAKAYKRGIFMLEIPEEIKKLNTEAKSFVRHEKYTEKYTVHQAEQQAEIVVENAGALNLLSDKVNNYVYATAQKIISAGKIPVVLGGEHSVPYGAIKALAENRAGGSFGVLHLDAHFDLRKAYEGLTFSHASIMYNVISNVSEVEKLVSVAVRDFCEEELEFASANKKIAFFSDNDLALAKIKGESWFSITERIISELPKNVWVSFDIDALDPSLSPHTGTPVPGGLSFHEANHILRRVVETGRKIVGADLCEVAVPSVEGNLGEGEWDANVGMRVLYKIFNWIVRDNSL